MTAHAILPISIACLVGRHADYNPTKWCRGEREGRGHSIFDHGQPCSGCECRCHKPRPCSCSPGCTRDPQHVRDWGTA